MMLMTPMKLCCGYGTCNNFHNKRSILYLSNWIWYSVCITSVYVLCEYLVDRPDVCKDRFDFDVLRYSDYVMNGNTIYVIFWTSIQLLFCLDKLEIIYVYEATFICVWLTYPGIGIVLFTSGLATKLYSGHEISVELSRLMKTMKTHTNYGFKSSLS